MNFKAMFDSPRLKPNIVQNECSVELKFAKVGNFGSGALSGKKLLIRIIESNKSDAYFRAVKVK